MTAFPTAGLYAIVDVDALATRSIEPLDFAIAVLEGGARVLQLRAKHTPDDDVITLLRRLGEPTRAAGALLFANDRPDLAAASGCDGVHVGQSDVPVVEVRVRFPHLLVGLSTHTEEETTRAAEIAPDYIAFGPIFPTKTKQDASPVVGLERLARVRGATRLPLVGIGGIDASTCTHVAARGALVAVVSALVDGEPSAAAIAARTRDLVDRITGPRAGQSS